MLGVGDDLTEIRVITYNSMVPTLDKYIGESESLYCIIQAINDESSEVRALYHSNRGYV